MFIEPILLLLKKRKSVKRSKLSFSGNQCLEHTNDKWHQITLKEYKVKLYEKDED